MFFEIGDRVAANPRIVRAEIKAGFRVEVHTWDHRSLTGRSTHTKPLTDVQVRWELVKCINAIVAAGAPRPTLWRPPYGDVNKRDAEIASSLGLRLVMHGRSMEPSPITETGRGSRPRISSVT